MAWRPDGSEAWVVIQHADLLVRLTVDDDGLPTINAPLQLDGARITRIDLQNPGKGKIPGKAPRGIVINRSGTRGFVYSFVSRSVSVIDLDSHTIVSTAAAAPLPAKGTPDAVVQLGAELFFTGRGPDSRMSQEVWGGCIVCHADGLTDSVTWSFDNGPRQTIPLDGMFNRTNTTDQRILNWSAVRDENQDFELNTRNVFGGRGLIEDDRVMFVLGGASGGSPADQSTILQFHQLLNTVSDRNVLAANAALPSLPSARRDFASATLQNGHIIVVGGRAGVGQGALITGADAVLEIDPFNNEVLRRNTVGFTPRHSLGAAAVQTAKGPRVYAIGGYTSTSGASTPTTLVEEYDPESDTWSVDTPIPAAVAQFGIAVSGPLNKTEPDQLIHVLGGNASSENAPSVSGAVRQFLANPDANGTWITLAVTITPRRNLGAASVVRGAASHVFGFGGLDQQGNALTTVEEYKVTDATQLVTPITQLAAGRHSFGITTALNRVFLIGGVDAAGGDLSSILEFNAAANPVGGTPGDPGEPSGAITTKTSLPLGVRGLQVSVPQLVANFFPHANTGRDARQDAIAEWIKRAVRTRVAPNHDVDVRAGRDLFGQEGLTGVAGVSCATCHGGAKWTRSTVDYVAPPSPDLQHGDQEVAGAELRKTASQPGDSPFNGVLIDVGTFVSYDVAAKTGRVNEVRLDPADGGRRLTALGANGFNIPSLLGVGSSAPYYHNGMATTLEEVLDGSRDGSGTSTLRSVHFVQSDALRQELIEFLKAIDAATPIFP
jgi:cytochrome c peroxidase